jgi:hypothetical protein
MCPDCRGSHFLHPEDMEDPEIFALNHRAILDDVRVLRQTRNITRLPRWLRSWSNKAWGVYLVDNEGMA